ncbi:MAG: hypothetical protein KA715_01150 [Xanthomonadaceae bacterium]|nr:hypothetical protein [Xanthomonadaceae bacterium]
MASTATPVIANVSRIVTKVVDRLTGDRSSYPLLVCLGAQLALSKHGIDSRILYGDVAWIEVLENHSVIWAGAWGEQFGFWVESEYSEVIDLNTSVAHRHKDLKNPDHKPLYSPPILWSSDVPKFYRYRPTGIAEIGALPERDQKWLAVLNDEIDQKCTKNLLLGDKEEFPNEPIICPGKKLLDDTQKTFLLYDRALSVVGIPQSPF